MCLDLGKLEGKKKILKSSFLFIVWFEESQKEKNREESCKENLSCYEEKFSPKYERKMKEKFVFNHLSKPINRLV